MARGKEVYEGRSAQVDTFGKDLARRAKSRCELCESRGAALRVFEIPPIPPTPEIERCLLLCENCAEQVEDPRKFQEGEHWRILAEQAWNENPMVQVVAIRLLRRQEATQDWAREALQDLYLDELTESLVTEGV